MVTPVFLLLILATFELGFMVHNYIKVTGAVGAAGRAVTVAGSSPEADYLAMQSLAHGLSTFDLESVERIVVFKASGPDDEVPLGCLSIPVPGGLECNGYQADDLFLEHLHPDGSTTGHWGCGSTARDQVWCPTDRRSSLSDPGGPDHVGIHIRVVQRDLTGLFGERRLEITRVARIEPSAN